MKLHFVCCFLLLPYRTGYAIDTAYPDSGPDVRFLVLDDVPRSRSPQMLESRPYRGLPRPYDMYDEAPMHPRYRKRDFVEKENNFVDDDIRVRHHGNRRRPSRTGGWEDLLSKRRYRYPRNRTLLGAGLPRRGSYSSLFDEFEPESPARPPDKGSLVRLGVHRIWYPGEQMPIEVKLKPKDDSRSYVVVIAKTVPDLKNISRGVGTGRGDGRRGAGPPEAAGGAVSVPRTLSMYTYRVPPSYLPREPRHLFVTVLMVSPGPNVDLRPYRRYKLITAIGDCRFLDEEEYDKSPNCKSAMVAGRTEVLCVCKPEQKPTKRTPPPPAVVAPTTSTTVRLQLREKFKPRKTLERRLFELPTLKPVNNCTMVHRSYLHRLLQRDYPLDNITTAEMLAVQIMQAENVLNNQSLYWACNSFSPIDEDRVILEKTKLRSLSIRRLEEILSKHYQACPLVTAGTVLAMQGPLIEVDHKVHEAAIETLRKSVRVLSRLPTKMRREMPQLPSIIRSVLKGEALLLAHRGNMETREQICDLSTKAMAVMDDTVNLVIQTQQGSGGGRAVYVTEGISLWYSRVDVAQLRRKSRQYVKPRIMLSYDESLYTYSKGLSVVVAVYQKNPFQCAMSVGPITTDVVRPYIRDEATGMRIHGPASRGRTMQVALQPDAMHGEDATAQLTATTMLIVKFRPDKNDGAIVVKIHPEFVKYFFMAFVHKDSEPSTKDLTQDQMYILHPLASFVVILLDEFRVQEGKDIWVIFVPLVEASVKALGMKNVKYPFWHRNDMSVWYSVSVYQWNCVSSSDGSSVSTNEGCVFSNVSRLGEIMCECHQNSTAVAGTSKKLAFSTHLKPLENVSAEDQGRAEKKEFNFYFLQYLIPILLAALWVNFVVLFYWTMKIAEIDEQTGAIAIAPENKPNSKEVYTLIFQTSYVQYAETTAKIQVELHGTEGTSGKFTLRDPRCNPYFLLAGSTNGLLLTTPATLGNIIVLSIFSDSEGTRPSWHLKKIDVFHEGTPEKFLFVVDKWLRFQGQDHADILPFVEGHGKKMSIMFSLIFPRVFRLCHLLVSVFAWPSGSRYTRLQRLVTILFLGVLTMFLVMLLQGFDPTSRSAPLTFGQEVEAGCITAAAVFLAGVVLQILFTFSKQLPPEKVRLASRDSHAEATKTARVLTVTKYTQYTRNPEIKIAYEMPEYRDESAANASKDARSSSLVEERVEEGILPTPFLYIGLLVALVLSVVLSGFMVPIGLKYGYEANISWFKSLIIAILLNNIVIDVVKSVAVAFYVASRKKK